MKTHKKLTPGERELLANHLASGKSKRECSRLLGRPLKTIKAEVKRNGGWLTNKFGQKVFVYVAISAQAKAEDRWLNSAFNKKAPQKLQSLPLRYQTPTEGLESGRHRRKTSYGV